jgi:hypothetical protein
METLELPALDEATDETPVVTFTGAEIDLAAFELWRQASQPENEGNE